jgi:hypothetical protein
VTEVLNKVYTLEHSYEYGEDLEYDESKMLGIYSSFEKAEEAKNRYSKLIGFADYDESCFYIDEYELNVDTGFTDGFVKV